MKEYCKPKVLSLGESLNIVPLAAVAVGPLAAAAAGSVAGAFLAGAVAGLSSGDITLDTMYHQPLKKVEQMA